MTAGTIDFWHPTRRCALHRGKGLAVRTGLLAATGELYLARQLGLQVAEVGVRAEERDGQQGADRDRRAGNAWGGAKGRRRLGFLVFSRW